MMKLYIIPILAIVVALVQVSPTNAQACTVTSFSQINAALASCPRLVLRDITVPARTTLTLNLRQGAFLQFSGTFKWNFSAFPGPLIQIIGDGVTVDGSGCIFDGEGPRHWDTLGDQGDVKPKFFKVKTTGGSIIRNINLLNCPKQCVSIDTTSDTILDNFNIDVSAGLANPQAQAQNTDGFDVSNSVRVTVQNSVITNQDDCVAVNIGSDLIFQNLTCIGGHGLSLSVGLTTQNGPPLNTVRNVTFSNCTVTDSQNGIHIKTHKDAGTGAISDITYKNIILSRITNFGVSVQQNYMGSTGRGAPLGNIPVNKLTLDNVTGTMNGRDSVAVSIICAAGACPNWSFSRVSITNALRKDICSFNPPGFTCQT